MKKSIIVSELAVFPLTGVKVGALEPAEARGPGYPLKRSKRGKDYRGSISELRRRRASIFPRRLQKEMNSGITVDRTGKNIESMADLLNVEGLHHADPEPMCGSKESTKK